MVPESAGSGLRGALALGSTRPSRTAAPSFSRLSLAIRRERPSSTSSSLLATLAPLSSLLAPPTIGSWPAGRLAGWLAGWLTGWLAGGDDGRAAEASTDQLLDHGKVRI